MLQINTSRRLDEIGAALASALQHHGGAVLAVTHLGKLVHSADRSYDAFVYTVCQTELYSALLAEDIRFGAFLPCRIAAIRQPDSVTLESLSPREFCRILNRTDLERLSGPLESFLRSVMEETAQQGRAGSPAGLRGAASNPGALETQMNTRAAVPQRIDCHGTKVEDLAGTGAQDSPGG